MRRCPDCQSPNPALHHPRCPNDPALLEEMTYRDATADAEVARLAATLLAGRAAHPHLEQLHEESGAKREAIVREYVKLARLILTTATAA
jgi:hypothetical protein